MTERKKLAILWAIVLAAFFFIQKGWCANSAGLSASGIEDHVNVSPIFEDGGNVWRSINVGQSTTNVVLISSTPENAVQTSSVTALALPGQPGTAGNLGIRIWRFREIVNASTCCVLALYPQGNYNQFSTSFSVVLASDTTGNGMGDSWSTQSQSDIWGIWSPSSPGGNPGTQGASGYEEYYDSRRRR